MLESARTFARVDVLVVVSLVGLGRRREQRLGELLRLDQTLGQLDPVHRTALLVLCPPRACARGESETVCGLVRWP